MCRGGMQWGCSPGSDRGVEAVGVCHMVMGSGMQWDCSPETEGERHGSVSQCHAVKLQPR